jgi:lathosterol oxidase
MSKAQWDKQVNEMERIVKEVEGDDDREYGPSETKKSK